MQKKFLIAAFAALLLGFIMTIPYSSYFKTENSFSEKEEENDEYDSPDEYVKLEVEKTKDPTLGFVPTQRLLNALDATLLNRMDNNNFTAAALSWQERGPNSDVTGPSNGNTRANAGITSGRIRAVMVDSADATHNTVWVAGVDGGLWKTTNINSNPANWILVNDFLSNLAVTSITQDPTNYNIMYFCTGEPFSNSDAVRGVGVFKSTDGGVTWNHLPSTSNYVYCAKIMCDAAGNIYLATRGNGLVRSLKASGGNNWTDITPTNVSNRISDIEISTNNNRMHISTGIFSAQTYRYTNDPSTVSSTSWETPTTPYPTYSQRCEITAMGNTLYALPVNTSYQVPTIYKSTDGGDNWAATAGQPAASWASGQGWYAVAAGINPANPEEIIVGGLDTHRSLDGGNTWTKISSWVGTTGQYVHADQHNIQWYDGGSKLLFGCDGGIHFSTDKGITIRDRNTGLRLKQFYSVAMHPILPNYFLAGAQDNGTHQFNNAGLSNTIEVTGGDGAFTDIDQDEPQFQFGAYVYNQYRRSVNGGATWSSVNFSSSIGQFINPFDYDDAANKLYAAHASGQYLRWNDPQTGNSSSLVPIPSFSGNVVSVTVSPFVANRVYFGTSSGRIVRVDNADGASPDDMNLTGPGMAGYLNSITLGNTEQNIVVCYSNYGINNIWVSNNGGSSWSPVDGNLPDMPIRWAVFNPDDNNKMFIATETGVWQTDLLNGSSTVWTSENSFPAVRTDMLRYRSSDRTLAAATHGRGLWTATIPQSATCNPPLITANPISISTCAATTASFAVVAQGDPTLTYQWQVSTDGGTTYTNISGATSATYTFTTTTTQNGYRYRAIVSNSCAPFNATSAAAILTLTSPMITVQPLPVVTCTGLTAVFSSSASGANATYQWQVSTNAGASYTNLSDGGNYSGVNTPILTISNASASMTNYLYRVVVTGVCAPAATSNGVALTVNIPAAITAQPQAIISCTEGTASFTVSATGTNISYQWQVSTTGVAGTYTNIPGATSPTYTINSVTDNQNGNYYRVLISAAAPCGNITSTPVLLTVNAKPVVSLTASPYQKLLPGLVTTLTVNSSLNSPSINYVWYKDGVILNAVTGKTYQVDISKLGSYKVLVTDGQNGCGNTTNTVVITDSTSDRLFIYPNPNNGLFTIAYYNDGTNNTQQRVVVYDMKGARVLTKSVSTATGYTLIPMSMQNNNAGVYLIDLLDATGKRLKTGKVFIR